jgi:5-methylcytosine-specific restriction endonuclease McrA
MNLLDSPGPRAEDRRSLSRGIKKENKKPGENMVHRIDYRKLAFQKYPPVCAHCGFGIQDVLEVCHIDGKRKNNRIGNLVILCPNCHKMYDINLISKRTIEEMRDRPKKVKWAKRMKDAGVKAALTRKKRIVALAQKRRKAARKAVETRTRNREVRP